MVRSQRNARIHLALTALALVMALWLDLNALEWALLALTVGFVFATEAINTAVEASIDLSSPEFHPLAKIAKDVAAGAVLAAALTALAVAVFLFGPKLFALMGG